MSQLRVDNYIINKSILDILFRLQLVLTNGKLRDIKKPSGGADNIVVTCPHHSNGLEKTPACNIYIGENGKLPYGNFHCLVCGERGSFVKFVAECFDSSEEYAKNWLIKTFEGELVEQQVFLDEPIQINKPKIKTNKLNPQVLENYLKWSPYLGQRKLSRDICELFNVRYDPKYRQIIFPTYDLKGNLVMMPKRSIDTKTFYLDKDVEKPVYCLDYIVKNNFKTAIITEGPFDCLTGWEYGYPTCATFGKISDYQIEQLNKSCLNVIYTCFDNDAAGKSFTNILKNKLDKRILLVEVQLPTGKKDLNELSKEELDKIIKKASNS
jgi:DNA primase